MHRLFRTAATGTPAAKAKFDVSDVLLRARDRRLAAPHLLALVGTHASETTLHVNSTRGKDEGTRVMGHLQQDRITLTPAGRPLVVAVSAVAVEVAETVTSVPEAAHSTQMTETDTE